MDATPTLDGFARHRFAGVAWAVAIALGWGGAVAFGVTGAYPGAGNIFVDIFWVALTVFLSTGLFITAHEAMHGLVLPSSPRFNRAVGTVALWAYGGLRFSDLEPAHWEHHREPSTEADPDYHEPRGRQSFGAFWRWYAGFLFEYATVWQFVWMGAVFNVALHGLGLNFWRLWLFWIAPVVLSTVQLFAVGTYLPHRQGTFEGHGPTRTRTVALPTWASFLACYHFGYHFEHHAWPFVPWWRLPEARAHRLGQRDAE